MSIAVVLTERDPHAAQTCIHRQLYYGHRHCHIARHYNGACTLTEKSREFANYIYIYNWMNYDYVFVISTCGIYTSHNSRFNILTYYETLLHS